MKVGCIIPVIRILTFDTVFSEKINLGKIQNPKFGQLAPQINFLFYNIQCAETN